MPDGCFLHLFQVTSQSSFENLSGNIEVELVDGYELWELIFIFLGELQVNVSGAYTAAPGDAF